MATDPVAPVPTVPPVPPARARGDKSVPVFGFLVEFAGPKNENIMCPLDNRVLRGKWARKNLIGKAIDGDFNGMPDLPGLCLFVHTGKRLVRIFDPLADPANEKIMKRAQRIAQKVTGVKMVPSKPKTWRDALATDTLLKTFCFWVLRLKDSGLVNVIKGTVPEWEEIRKLPGQIELQQFNQLAGIVRGTPDDMVRYAKPMPEEQEDGLDEEFRDELPDAVISTDGAAGERPDEDD